MQNDRVAICYAALANNNDGCVYGHLKLSLYFENRMSEISRRKQVVKIPDIYQLNQFKR